MDEEHTFNKLRQTPVDKVLILLENIQRPPPVFSFGNGSVFERKDFYPEITFYLERMALLKEHGWTAEEFYKELEKRSIIEMVKEYNATIKFPQDFLDRAKRSFPNARFVHASIELE